MKSKANSSSVNQTDFGSEEINNFCQEVLHLENENNKEKEEKEKDLEFHEMEKLLDTNGGVRDSVI